MELDDVVTIKLTEWGAHKVNEDRDAQLEYWKKVSQNAELRGKEPIDLSELEAIPVYSKGDILRVNLHALFKIFKWHELYSPKDSIYHGEPVFTDLKLET